MNWLQSWRQRQEERLLQNRPIPEPLWQYTLARHPFLARRSDADVNELRRLTTLFLARKEFTGGGGFLVTDEVAVAVAAQACVPVLRLGLAMYDGFVGIVMHHDEVVARREVLDEDGVMHHYDEVLAGEAMEGGPVTLSWHDVQLGEEAAELGYNVVIHEFVHKIDMLDGEADGIPPLPAAARQAWADCIDADYERFCDRVDRGRPTFLDPYGAEGVDEFFAVAAEAFFVAPIAFRDEHAALYALFRGYFGQDPAAF
ncbi:zinc-dependent peptidase [Aquabacterium sp. A7-Y]|nr:M90 family metallopeptidase [Aquabacterium sp. A7-Y]MCW7537789.1 zinc-dependent peptidase [Aquabacterium sp. A7-Y]